jgi:hypothetical protein
MFKMFQSSRPRNQPQA